MINKNVLDRMNEQIAHELYSGYLYLSMSAYFEAENLPGFAHWMRVQAAEEQVHAMKFFDFILDRGGKVVLKTIDEPPADFASPQAVFAQSYEHEQKVTGLINDLYNLSASEKDLPSQIFLQWFIDEQVEEEKNASQILEILKKIGTGVGGLYQLDHRLSKRGDED
jgi:ferritin